ncbi:MAG: cation:dicarboxylase symporter family transporter, partial [bacterium]
MEGKSARLRNQIILFIIATAAFILLYSFPAQTFRPVPPSIIQLIRVCFLFISLFIICERLIKIQIYNKIFIGLVLGAVAGIVFKSSVAEVKPVGDAFIRLIRMVIIPLVFASLLIGTASMDPKKMGRIGLKTLVYYLVYTAFAIFVGLILANTLKPGSGLPDAVRDQLLQNFSADGARVSGLAGQANPIDTLLNIIPTNLFEGLGQGIILQIIFFAIFAGVALALIPKKKSGPVLSFFDGINDTMIK